MIQGHDDVVHCIKKYTPMYQILNAMMEVNAMIRTPPNKKSEQQIKLNRGGKFLVY